MHTNPTEKDYHSTLADGIARLGLDVMPAGALHAIPQTAEEQRALEWLDDIFDRDLDCRIGRMRWVDDETGEKVGQPVWTLKFNGAGNWFVGHEGESLRIFILHCYRQATEKSV